MITVTLTGSALKAEATRLAIPGRSKMSADQLREAVASTLATLATAAAEIRTDEEYREVLDDTTEGAESDDIGYLSEEESDPAGDLESWAGEVASRLLSERGGTSLPQQRPRPVSEPMAAPVTPAVFATRWGKRKPSLHGRIGR